MRHQYQIHLPEVWHNERQHWGGNVRESSTMKAKRSAPDEVLLRGADHQRSPSIGSSGTFVNKGSIHSTTESDLVFAPPPTGDAETDTANLLNALDASPGTTVVLQTANGAVYVVNKELPVPRGVRVTGLGAPADQDTSGLAPTIQQEYGTSLKCIMASAGYLAGLYKGSKYNNGHLKRYADQGIEIDHITFDGQNGGASAGNIEGHGVVLYSIGSKVHDCVFLNIAESAIVVADQNYRGLYCKDQNFENRVLDNYVVNPGDHGIWVTHTSGAIGATDGYLSNNVIVAPAQYSSDSPRINPSTSLPYEGIRMDNAAGWWISDNLVSTCPGNGFYLNTTWGVHLIRNTVDGFGTDPRPNKTYCGFQIITSGAIKTHPGFVCGNLASAFEGWNPDGAMAACSKTTFRYFEFSMQVEDYDIAAWFVVADNAAHQGSQTPESIGTASVALGSNVVSVPSGSTSELQAGMTITDSERLIPAGSTILGLSSGSTSDSIAISSNATGSSSTDTLSFPGPKSYAWTYVNNEPGSLVTVLRANEAATGSINPEVQVSGTGKFELIDPLTIKGGTMITGEANPQEFLVVTAAATSSGLPVATWQTFAGYQPVLGASTFRASGSWTIPQKATVLRITCIGGGGGGGGGGGAVARTEQAGGSGGASGTSSEQVVPITGGSVLQIIVGNGGAGGKGGSSGGDNSGEDGADGADSAVTGPSVSVRGKGGPGGKGAPGGSTAQVDGAGYGGHSGSYLPLATGGCGGSTSMAGGSPVHQSPGGGAGGSAAVGSSGGPGGGAGTATSGGTPGAGTPAVGETGGSGQPASTVAAGGGGGGGGTNSGGGGDGGAGAAGTVIIEVLSWQ